MKLLLKCRILPGMFSDERVVEIAHPGGGVSRFLVPTSIVEDGRQAICVEVSREYDESVVCVTFLSDGYRVSAKVRPEDVYSE